MTIKDISRTNVGVQIVTHEYWPSDKPIVSRAVRDGDVEWPRVKAAAEQLANTISGIIGMDFDGLDRQVFVGGLLECQYSWRRRQ